MITLKKYILICVAILVITIAVGCSVIPTRTQTTGNQVSSVISGDIIRLDNIPNSDDTCYGNNCLRIIPICDKHIVCVVAYTPTYPSYVGGIVTGIDCKTKYQDYPFYQEYCP